MELDALKALIRDIPGYPKPGIVFKDITPLLGDGATYRRVVDELVARGWTVRPVSR